MKHFSPQIRARLLICQILLISLCFHSSLLAQTKKKATPGTLESLSTSISSNTISSAAIVTGLQQFYSSTGHYTISADGIGSLSSSMNIRVNKPNNQATVQKAILISSVTGSTIDNGCVTIAATPVNWDGTAAASGTVSFNNYWADVTSIVASTINSFPAGISTLPITECNTDIIEGEALLVVFNDPSAAEKTVIVMVGAENPQGDNFSVTLAKPIDPKAPGALLDMGLGIGFSYQANATNQASQVSVNSQRISSSAGGEDDGASADGALITVGGIGDSDDNPSDPLADPTNPRSDDELYSILPSITNTTTSLTINTINPSLDDNIFLAYFVTSGAAVIGEGILLSQTSDSGNVGDNHTVKAALVDANGQPITNRSVKFSITSGPNAGNTFSATTDASGNASYTYTGTGGSGTDSIQACFTNSQNQTNCSNILSFKWIAASTPNTPPYFDYPPTPTNGTTINTHPGESVIFTVKSEDNDMGDHVILTATGLPVGSTTVPSLPASGNPASIQFNWTPAAGDVGTHQVYFIATDNSGANVSTSVIINVNPTVINTPPYFDYTITPANNSTLEVKGGDTLRFAIKAMDNDAGDKVTLTSSGLPSGVMSVPMLPTTGNPDSVVFIWIPSVSDAGTYPVHFIATDNAGDTVSTTVIINVISTGTSCDKNPVRCHIKVLPNPPVPGQEWNTIYKGYGLQNLLLYADVDGGKLPYTYKWSGGTKFLYNPFRLVSPNCTTTYNLEVTDAKGCTTTCSVTIKVIDVRCGNRNDRVKVCLWNHTVCLNKWEVSYALFCGGKLGDCHGKNSDETIAGSIAGTKVISGLISPFIKAYPNPADKYLNVQWNAGIDDHAILRVMDLQGRVLMAKQYSGLLKTGVNNTRLELNGFAKGMYILQLTGKGGSQTIKFTVQ